MVYATQSRLTFVGVKIPLGQQQKKKEKEKEEKNCSKLFSHHGLSAVWFQARTHLLRHTRVRVEAFLARCARRCLRHGLAAGHAITGVGAVAHTGGSRHEVTELVTQVSTAVPRFAHQARLCGHIVEMRVIIHSRHTHTQIKQPFTKQ